MEKHKEYKFVKSLLNIEKGTVLTLDKDLDLYTSSSDNGYVAISEEIADNMVENGTLISVEYTEEEVACDTCTRMENLKEFVSAALTAYEDKHEEIIEKYNNQEIPACVKVEADTVYFNLIKVLNKVNSIIGA